MAVRHQRQHYQSVQAMYANDDDAADDDDDDHFDQDELKPFRHQRHQSVQAMHANVDL